MQAFQLVLAVVKAFLVVLFSVHAPGLLDLACRCSVSPGPGLLLVLSGPHRGGIGGGVGMTGRRMVRDVDIVILRIVYNGFR